MKGKTIAVLSISALILTATALILYRRYKNRKATEAHIGEMVAVAKETSDNSFAGMNEADVYNRFKNTLDSEVKRMIAILKKGKDKTEADISEYKILYNKAIETYLAAE